jgi:hypothetical protein
MGNFKSTRMCGGSKNIISFDLSRISVKVKEKTDSCVDI